MITITALDLQTGDTLKLFDGTTPSEFICWLSDGTFERGQYPTGLVYFSGRFHAFEVWMYATMDTQTYDVFESARTPRPGRRSVPCVLRSRATRARSRRWSGRQRRTCGLSIVMRCSRSIIMTRNGGRGYDRS